MHALYLVKVEEPYSNLLLSLGTFSFCYDDYTQKSVHTSINFPDSFKAGNNFPKIKNMNAKKYVCVYRYTSHTWQFVKNSFVSKTVPFKIQNS